jgi:LmbE family N-acetylglucosaminyl deacetylase
MAFSEAWETPKEILVILAHPDDPEFFLGGTIARWVKLGHRVRYVLFTHGDKGVQNAEQSSADLISIRDIEQSAAATVLGVSSIEYLNYEDGYLEPDLEMRKTIVRCIRKHRPHIVVTCDPSNLFPNDFYINHPDHRYAGQVVIDAVFPGVGNHLFFPELLEEGLPPHAIEEVWMSLTSVPNVTLDVTDHFQDKLEALKKHESQIGDPIIFEKHMLERMQTTEDGTQKYEEQFRRIIFRRQTA